MKKLGTVKFTGKSGTRYAFAAYPLDPAPAAGFQGVYVVTRRREGKFKGGFVHLRIGLGQSDGAHKPLEGAGRSFAARGANCICLYPEKDEGGRRNVVLDLRRKPSAPSANA
jgi:hypothetical protein